MSGRRTAGACQSPRRAPEVGESWVFKMQRKKERKAYRCTAGYPAVFVSYPGLLVSEKNPSLDPFPVFNSEKLMREREK